MDFILKYLDQLILIAVGLFIALNPSTFVRGFDKKALKTMKLVRIIGIMLALIFLSNIIYLASKS
jgi:Ni,Fe-hydrogenase I cytochrome b subunit